jgi:RecA-family ATPase
VSTTFDKWSTQIYTAKDALKDRPPRQYLVKPFFLLPSINIIYGSPGSLKTNFVIDLAVCVSLGRKWLMGRPDLKFGGYETMQGAVMWVDKDSGEDDLHERFGATIRGHKGHEKLPIHYMSFPEPTFTAMKEESVNAIIEYARKFKVKLIAFDNLGTTSGAKSLKEDESIEVMQRFRLISRKVNATVIIIHHDTKIMTNRRESSSGHTGIGGAVNQEIHLTRDHDEVNLKSTKTRNKGFEPFNAYWSYHHRTGTIDLEQCKFFGLAEEEDADYIRVKDVVFDYLSSNGASANQSMLFSAGKKNSIGRPTMKAMIDRMIEKKDLFSSVSKRGAYSYRLESR